MKYEIIKSDGPVHASTNSAIIVWNNGLSPFWHRADIRASAGLHCCQLGPMQHISMNVSFENQKTSFNITPLQI